MPTSPTPPASRLALLLATIALTLGAAAAPSVAAFPGRDGLILSSWASFTETEFGPPITTESAIRASSPSGGPPVTLRGCRQETGKPDVGDCSIRYGSPGVSPDGKRIAFDAGSSLALMSIDGSSLRLLPAHSADDGEPAFSPTAKRLAFSSGPVPSVHHPLARGVWTSDLAGGRAQRVTARGTAPNWSTRNWIALVRSDGVYRVRPDGHGLRRLVAVRGCRDVAWAPGGTKLAFACLVKGRDRLYVADGDGSRRHRIAVRDLSPERVAWSPSGRRLAVTSFDGSLVTMRLDGSHERGIVSGGAGALYNFGAGSADWQPLP